MFLVTTEVSIVGTSLISITNDLHGFSQMGWVVTGYLITYTSPQILRVIPPTMLIIAGVIIIWTKLSDLYGRKQCIIATTFIFVIFSGGCGAAQTMTQL